MGVHSTRTAPARPGSSRQAGRWVGFVTSHPTALLPGDRRLETQVLSAAPGGGQAGVPGPSQHPRAPRLLSGHSQCGPPGPSLAAHLSYWLGFRGARGTRVTPVRSPKQPSSPPRPHTQRLRVTERGDHLPHATRVAAGTLATSSPTLAVKPTPPAISSQKVSSATARGTRPVWSPWATGNAQSNRMSPISRSLRPQTLGLESAGRQVRTWQGCVSPRAHLAHAPLASVLGREPSLRLLQAVSPSSGQLALRPEESPPAGRCAQWPPLALPHGPGLREGRLRVRGTGGTEHTRAGARITAFHN